VFFAAPGAAFPVAEQAAGLLGEELDSMTRIALLAGLQHSGAPAGNIVCACFSVGESTIREAIMGGKLSSPAQIGAAVRAGTNCGSCIPELKKLLAAAAAASTVAA
jgi:assimilatory nitrate reductase catalytic subunit